MNMTLSFCLRVALAGVLGALVGFEREYRAKGAGVRTHFLVAVGSALMMIVSQWAFVECLQSLSASLACEVKLDPSRVAAQVVSGIGFIGAGTIMMHKQFVRGLTTAAGLWAVAGIGLAIGGGMYILGCVCTVLVLLGLEGLQLFSLHIKTRTVHIVLRTTRQVNLQQLTEDLAKLDIVILSYSVEPKDEYTRVDIRIREHAVGEDYSNIVNRISKHDDVEIEKIE